MVSSLIPTTAFTVAAIVLASPSASASSALATPPIWGPRWTTSFLQDIWIFGFKFQNEVQYWYDDATEIRSQLGQSLYMHGEGQKDEICTSVVGQEYSSQPCNLLASKDSWRYVIFPQNSPPLCCRYCNTTDYCGIIRPDWLQQNATYQGVKSINGYEAIGWMKEGGEQNYYWSTNDASTLPVQYYEGYPTFNVGNNTWNFATANTTTGPIDPSIFAVPTNMGCDQPCQTTSIPYKERLEVMFAREGKKQ